VGYGVSGVAFRDLLGSFQRLPLAFTLAADDIGAKYRRTVLGPLWIAIGQAVSIGAFVVVFSGIFDTPPADYAPYLAAGFPVWTLISSFMIDMPLTFMQSKGYLESFELPWLTQIWRRTFGYLIIFMHQVFTLFFVMAILDIPPHIEMLYAIPGLILVMVAGTGIGMLLAVAGARYRDLQPAMAIVAGFLFLFTPVIWRADQLQRNQWAYEYNPVYDLMSMVREPLLGRGPEPEVWAGGLVAAISLFVIGYVAFHVSRGRLYHWL
jgi:ABC-type polysaccharide/polyol phosphate export permease